MKLPFTLQLLACASGAALLAAPAANAQGSGLHHRLAKAAAAVGDNTISVELFETSVANSYPLTTAGLLTHEL